MDVSEQSAVFLQKGQSITQPRDRLSKISLETLYQSIYKPSAEIKSQLDRLRTIKTIDEKQYRKQKLLLPYVTTGIFNPPFRKTENFAAIRAFILDLDHISEHNKNLTELKIRLAQDDRVALLFESPGGDGLKVFFVLKEKCFDRQKYSLFYKVFVHKFAADYQLHGIIDTRTSDVTRACFLSEDAEAYFNPNPLLIEPDTYVNFESPAEIREAELFVKEEEHKQAPPEAPQTELPDDLFAEIKQKLNPKLKVKKDKHIVVPEKLNTVMEEAEKVFTDKGISLKEVRDIHYGKKLLLEYKQYTAELNLFFGKRGFTVVKSPKKGTNADLRDLCYRLLCDFLY